MGSNENDEEVDCREALHRIYHFLDGELTPDRRAEIESHLNSCSPCLQMFGFEAELRRVVANKCRDSVPSSLRARIAESIDHEHHHDPDHDDHEGADHDHAAHADHAHSDHAHSDHAHSDHDHADHDHADHEAAG